MLQNCITLSYILHPGKPGSGTHHCIAHSFSWLQDRALPCKPPGLGLSPAQILFCLASWNLAIHKCRRSSQCMHLHMFIKPAKHIAVMPCSTLVSMCLQHKVLSCATNLVPVLVPACFPRRTQQSATAPNLLKCVQQITYRSG